MKKRYFGLLVILIYIIMKLFIDPAHFKANEALPEVSKDVLLQLANVDRDEQA